MAVRNETKKVSSAQTDTVLVPKVELKALKAERQALKNPRKSTSKLDPASQPTKSPEESYHALIRMANDMGLGVVMLRDIEGKHGIQVFVNDIWTDITGYTEKELLGKSFFELIKQCDKKASLTRHARRMSGIPVPGKFEISIIKKNKQEALVEVSSAVSHSDAVLTNIAYIRDVTGEKTSEAKAKEFENSFQTLVDLGNNTGEAI